MNNQDFLGGGFRRPTPRFGDDANTDTSELPQLENSEVKEVGDLTPDESSEAYSLSVDDIRSG